MNPYEQIIAALEPGIDETQCYSGQVKSRRVTRLVLRYWPSDSMPTSRSRENKAAVKDLTNELHRTVKRQYGGSKFNPLLLIFLGPVISYVINMLLDWWFAGVDMRQRVMVAVEEEKKQAEP